MKNLFLILALVVIFSCPVLAQVTGYVENQLTFVGSEVTSNIDLYLSGSIVGKLGWSAWSLSGQYWSEAYVGSTFSPTPWSQLGVFYGVESANPAGRYATSLWFGIDEVSFLYIYEDGGSGSWYRAVGNFNLLNEFGLGFVGQRCLGNGPRVQINAGKFVGWATTLQKNGTSTELVGIRYTF
ncbi:MAG: hypothetical protein QMD50_03615 [Patescibacteria group bacterium]|nr:hypothetical protein [Patescibacteria group bacterium]